MTTIHNLARLAILLLGCAASSTTYIFEDNNSRMGNEKLGVRRTCTTKLFRLPLFYSRGELWIFLDVFRSFMSVILRSSSKKSGRGDVDECKYIRILLLLWRCLIERHHGVRIHVSTCLVYLIMWIVIVGIYSRLLAVSQIHLTLEKNYKI